MEGDSIACFAFGSNGTDQLRERCQNSSLQSYKAAIYDYRRIFAGDSKKWGGGGVASLVRTPGHMCKGSAVYLSKNELDLLDGFEGIPEGCDPFCIDFSRCRYARTWVTVVVWPGKDAPPETVKAIAYIRNRSDWEGIPSKKYLSACYTNLAPFWPEIDRYGKLMVYDGQGKLHAEFSGEIPALHGVEQQRSFLGRQQAHNTYEPQEVLALTVESHPQQITRFDGPSHKVPLYAAVCVYAVEPDSIQGTVLFNYRLYLTWEINGPLFRGYLEQARAAGGRLILNDQEFTEFSSKTIVPIVSIYNQIDEPTVQDQATARIFAPSLVRSEGGNSDVPHDGISRGWVMWNAQYSTKVKGKFNFHDFPFDNQVLELDLKLVQAQHNEAFELVLCSAQYHKRALDIHEWNICKPIVTRVNKAQSTLGCVVERVHEYYVWNICVTMSGVTGLSMLAFTCELRGNGERLGVNMTLLLTAVAFKLLLSESLPKVSYMTILDKWMNACLFVLFAATNACVAPSFFKADAMAEEVNLVCAVGVAMMTWIICPLYLVLSSRNVSGLSPKIEVQDQGRTSGNWIVWDYTNIWFLMDYQQALISNSSHLIQEDTNPFFVAAITECARDHRQDIKKDLI